VKELVPEPLKPNADNVMSVFVATFHAAGIGPYHEAGIVVPASFQGIEGRYIAYMYLDQDNAIAAGREIWGYPKKEARFSLVEKDGMIRAVVERGGVEIIKASLILGDLVKEPEKLPPPKPAFNLKIIPSVRQGARPDVQQLTSNTVANYRLLKAYKGDATMEFGISPADPLHRIKVEKILGGSYSQVEFDLTYGEVLYDYLSR
jgi:acetoacetate decarboxylase